MVPHTQINLWGRERKNNGSYLVLSHNVVDYNNNNFVQSNPDTVGDTEKNDRVMSCANCVFLPSKEEAMKLISQMPDDMLQMYGLRPMPQKSSLRTASRHPVSEDIQPSKRNDNQIQTDEIGAERLESLFPQFHRKDAR